MISDEERRNMAQKLRNATLYTRGTPADWWMRVHESVTGEDDFPCPPETIAAIADLIEPCPIDGETSDGYHTFNELYHHRAVLFSVIVATFGERAWKSKLHADGTMYEGMFIVGIETPDGQATYHYDVEPYWNLFRCKEVDRAPEWDGHTPGQAIERIGKLVDLIDRPTCRNIYAETVEVGACENGFECSECGNTVEDYEGYRVRGEFNYCSKCGAEVVE